MVELPIDFKDLLEEFARGGVDAVLVGGYAVAFHARPRATKDIDLVLSSAPPNLERAAEALARFGAPQQVVDAVAAMTSSDVVFLGRPPLRIDLLLEIEGVSNRDLFDRSIQTSLDGVTLRVISLDDLIANKLAVGRPQDLIDAALLERVRRRSG